MKTFTKVIEDKTLIAIAEPYLELQAESLLTLFSRIDSTKLIDGFSLQIGWSRYILSARGDRYHILVLDYSKNPFKDTTEDLTIALWVQLEQSHCLRQLAIEGTAITYSDKIVASKNVLQRDSIYLQRNPGDAKGDSG